MNKVCIFFLLLGACTHQAPGRGPASVNTLTSPDGKLEVVLEDREETLYRAFYAGFPVVDESALGLELQGHSPIRDLEVVKIIRREADSVYVLPVGKTARLRDKHENFYVEMRERTGTRRRVDIEFRMFDDGFAFRYVIPNQDEITDVVITGERTAFTFAPGDSAFALPLPVPSTFEGYYLKNKIENLAAGATLNLPLLVKRGKLWVAVTEAGLTDFPGLNLARTSAGTFGSVLSSNAVGPAPLKTPWRAVLVSPRAGALLESNLISNLNEPAAIRDTSWIRPGKIIFPWWSGYRLEFDPKDKNPAHRPGLNTWSLKKYIDFAAANGIEFFSIDGYDQAWYGGDIGNPVLGIDLTKAIPQIDLPEVLRYARAKKVRARIWMHADPLLRSDIDHVFSVYKKWGIEGVMIDFINKDDQESVRAHTKMIQLAAKHRLTINFHGVWKPTGFSRTYPNLLSHEAVLSSEYNRFTDEKIHGSTPEHETVYAWVRAIAGPADIHPGSFNPVMPEAFKPDEDYLRAMGTLARQLALYVVIESGLPMASDAPAEYLKRPRAFEFVKKVPAAWDETRVLAGEPGESIAVARRKGNAWFIGAITDRNARKLSVPLKFLGSGKFRAEIWADDPAKPGEVIFKKRNLNAADTLDLELSPSGGQAVRITR